MPKGQLCRLLAGGMRAFLLKLRHYSLHPCNRPHKADLHCVRIRPGGTWLFPLHS